MCLPHNMCKQFFRLNRNVLKVTLNPLHGERERGRHSMPLTDALGSCLAAGAGKGGCHALGGYRSKYSVFSSSLLLFSFFLTETNIALHFIYIGFRLNLVFRFFSFLVLQHFFRYFRNFICCSSENKKRKIYDILALNGQLVGNCKQFGKVNWKMCVKPKLKNVYKWNWTQIKRIRYNLWTDIPRSNSMGFLAWSDFKPSRPVKSHDFSFNFRTRFRCSLYKYKYLHIYPLLSEAFIEKP